MQGLWNDMRWPWAASAIDGKCQLICAHGPETQAPLPTNGQARPFACPSTQGAKGYEEGRSLLLRPRPGRNQDGQALGSDRAGTSVPTVCRRMCARARSWQLPGLCPQALSCTSATLRCRAGAGGFEQVGVLPEKYDVGRREGPWSPGVCEGDWRLVGSLNWGGEGGRSGWEVMGSRWGPGGLQEAWSRVPE